MIDNTVSIVKNKEVQDLDNKVYKKMENLPNLLTLSHEEIKNEVMDTIIENRLKKNTKDGYWILGFEEEAVDEALYGNIKIKKDVSLMLMSDGFSCVKDRYQLVKENKLIKIVREQGVKSIFSRLRKFEQEKLSINKYPRFKISDDSSCIYLNINID